MSYQAVNCWLSGAPADPHFASVKMLLSMDGADGSKVFIDESPAAHGQADESLFAEVDTAQKVFGTGSFTVAGINVLEYPDHADWHLAAGDFTIETWVRFTNTTGFQVIASQYTATTQQAWVFQRGSAGDLQFVYSANGTTNTTHGAAWSPSIDTWYAVCAERSGSTIRLYVDGAMLGSAGSITATIFNSTALFRIGALQSGGLTSFFKGWIDEFRFTKGVARYNSDSGYTVPTSAFPRF